MVLTLQQSSDSVVPTEMHARRLRDGVLMEHSPSCHWSYRCVQCQRNAATSIKHAAVGFEVCGVQERSRDRCACLSDLDASAESESHSLSPPTLRGNLSSNSGAVQRITLVLIRLSYVLCAWDRFTNGHDTYGYWHVKSVAGSLSANSDSECSCCSSGTSKLQHFRRCFRKPINLRGHIHAPFMAPSFSYQRSNAE
ncbi:hypothetical protein DAEQUDRAFT_490735 [Daedalea quercina L-15889]|uniref:Uncharacterized protein n=1 Tax=Daedalea quercina L-15889 TaxID=1314783 RepID=A0A165MP81_9APHY|nr:hypothetical protein DAEQUDRAFT_490735 [Daedalea quercina L-15889]